VEADRANAAAAFERARADKLAAEVAQLRSVLDDAYAEGVGATSAVGAVAGRGVHCPLLTSTLAFLVSHVGRFQQRVTISMVHTSSQSGHKTAH